MKVYPMRRQDRETGREEGERLLAQGEYGILGLAPADSEDWPYAVPLSYAWHNGGIYFHCAREGRKILCIRSSPKACFTVTGATQPIYRKDFSTLYESVMAFGSLREVHEDEEKYAALYALARKYLPEREDKADQAIRHSFSRTAVYVLVPELISAKAKR